MWDWRSAYDEITLQQRKTGEPHRVALSAPTRKAIETWLLAARKLPDDLVFTGIKAPQPAPGDYPPAV